MKPTLTLTFESMNELAEFVAGKGSAVINTATTQPAPVQTPITPAPVHDEDDENAPVNTQAPAVDSDGVPWDERIHAPSKAQNKDDTWRKKKKLDPAFVASVEAELKAAVAQSPAPVAPVTSPPMPPVDQQQQPAPVQQMPPPVAPVAQTAPPMPPVDQQQQPAPVQQTAPPTPAPAPAAEGMDFHTFMQHLSAQMQKRDDAGQPMVNADYLAKITAEIATAFQIQLTAITDIAAQPNMIAYAVQSLQRDGKWG